MHGAGNDFVVIDNRQRSFPIENTSLIRLLCHRGDGIGSEGLILLEPSAHYAFFMRFFNPDGSPADMCGNGARCIARWAVDHQLCDTDFTFDTLAGPVSASVSPEAVTITLPPPSRIDAPLTLNMGTESITGRLINTGVPHFVCHCEHHPDTLFVARVGAAIRYHPAFEPQGTNVDFFVRESERQLFVRTYERGVEAETPACGTGITATALAAHLDLAIAPPLAVRCLHGDTLRVDFTPEPPYRNLSLTGPACHVFDGHFKLANQKPC